MVLDSRKPGLRKLDFKSAFAPADGLPMREEEKAEEVKKTSVSGTKMDDGVEVESDTDDEGYEMYDPRNPTD